MDNNTAPIPPEFLAFAKSLPEALVPNLFAPAHGSGMKTRQTPSAKSAGLSGRTASSRKTKIPKKAVDSCKRLHEYLHTMSTKILGEVYEETVFTKLCLGGVEYIDVEVEVSLYITDFGPIIPVEDDGPDYQTVAIYITHDLHDENGMLLIPAWRDVNEFIADDEGPADEAFRKILGS